MLPTAREANKYPTILNNLSIFIQITIQCTLDYPRVNYPVLGLSMHNRSAADV